jgi:cytochrome c oxidase subunit 3
MSLSAAFVALLAGVVVWALLVRKLTVKPWEALVTTGTGLDDDDAERTPARVGLWVFLAVVTSLFGLFISAYYMRMGHGHGEVHDWLHYSKPSVLWLNTGLLILASVAMQWARTSVALGRTDRTRDGLLVGGLLTVAFLAGQFLAWRQLSSAKVFDPTNPSIAFFYLLTAVHGLHLFGGLVVWARTLLRMRKRETELIDVRLSVELCTTYWHYLLFVWLVLFALLLAT